MSLKSKLDQVREQMSMRARTACEEVITRLHRAELAVHAAKTGETAPGFLLPDADGRLVASADLLAGGPLVLTFFRGGWCPYCNITMRVMETALPAIASAGGRFAAIWPDTGGAAARAKRELMLSYDFLIDVDNIVATLFGIVFRLPPLYRALLSDGGIDLAERHGNTAWLLPVPATFIIAPDGVIRYASVNVDFRMRVSPEEIVRQLEALRP